MDLILFQLRQLCGACLLPTMLSMNCPSDSLCLQSKLSSVLCNNKCIDNLHSIGHVNLAAFTGTIFLVPCLLVKSLPPIWRSGTRRFHLRVPDLQMSWGDLITWQRNTGATLTQKIFLPQFPRQDPILQKLMSPRTPNFYWGIWSTLVQYPKDPIFKKLRDPRTPFFKFLVQILVSG